MNRKLFVLALFALAVAAAPTMAQQTAQTQVNMNMPSFVVLYYRNAVTFDISEAQLASLVGHASGTVDEGSTTLNDFSGDAGVTGSGFTEPSSLSGTVTNFWGVRSIGAPGEQTQVSVSVTTGTISNGTDTIAISNALTRTAGGGAFSASSVTFAPTGLGAGNIQLGDVQFDVDLSGVSSSGAYTGGVVEVTAQNI